MFCFVLFHLPPLTSCSIKRPRRVGLLRILTFLVAFSSCLRILSAGSGCVGTSLLTRSIPGDKDALSLWIWEEHFLNEGPRSCFRGKSRRNSEGDLLVSVFSDSFTLKRLCLACLELCNGYCERCYSLHLCRSFSEDMCISSLGDTLRQGIA